MTNEPEMTFENEVAILERLGGITDDEAQELADYNRDLAEMAERMIENLEGEEKETWEGILNWRRERIRLFKEWAAKESQSQDEFAKRQGEKDDG